MSQNVWRGRFPSLVNITGDSTWVTLPHAEVESAPFCTVNGSGVVTFSEAGYYWVAQSCHTITGNGSAGVMDLAITVSGDNIFRRIGAIAGSGWGFGGMISGMWALQPGNVCYASAVVTGTTKTVPLGNMGFDGGNDLLIAKLGGIL